jgi:hypothetical protein
MHEARLIAKIFNEFYKVCGAKERLVMEAMREVLSREIIYYQHPRRVEIFEWILNGFRKDLERI